MKVDNSNTSVSVPQLSLTLGWYSSEPARFCAERFDVADDSQLGCFSIATWRADAANLRHIPHTRKEFPLSPTLILLCLNTWVKSRHAAITFANIFGPNVWFNTLSSPQHGQMNLSASLPDNPMFLTPSSHWVFVTLLSPSLSVFGLSVVTDAAASVKIYQKFGD